MIYDYAGQGDLQLSHQKKDLEGLKIHQ